MRFFYLPCKRSRAPEQESLLLHRQRKQLVLHLYLYTKRNKMIRAVTLFGLILMSCGATRSTENTGKADSTAGQLTGRERKDSIPLCISARLDSFKKLEPAQQLQSLTEFTYKGQKVYYFEMPCCDFFNEVYDASCHLLGAPDGGFTGRGDGKLPGFAKEATDKKLIWKAKP